MPSQPTLVPAKSSTKRDLAIDVAKGIAMICIILGHLGIQSINRVVFPFHVPIFFLITGYFTHTYKPLPGFLKNKARTILVPYAVACLVTIFLGTAIGFLKGSAWESLRHWTFASLYGSGNSYQEPFFIPKIGALWFLWATFWGSLFLNISLRFQRIPRLLFVLATFVAGYLSAKSMWLPLSIQAGACALLFMYFGYLLRLSKDNLTNLPTELKMASTLFAGITWLFFIKDFSGFWLVGANIGRGITDIFGALCACFIVFLVSKWIATHTTVAKNSLAYFGKYSLLLLCVHIIELNLFPWLPVANRLISYTHLPATALMPLIIVGKLSFNLFATYLLSRSRHVRHLMGYKE